MNDENQFNNEMLYDQVLQPESNLISQAALPSGNARKRMRHEQALPELDNGPGRPPSPIDLEYLGSPRDYYGASFQNALQPLF